MIQTQERLRIAVSEDRRTVTVEFMPPSGVSGSLTLEAEQLLTLIQSLGKVHAMMTEERDQPALEGVTIESAFNRRWHVQPELIGEATSLSFHHPAYGPVSFLVPIDQVAHMTRLLTEQLEAHQALRGSAPQ
ncbi:hypothetical protein [Bosea sp. BK604]|uniref:hypothetical protein n=1 Tax=Bosea sp. BK604 TaxID=2512180 RepID=UPI00105342DA|nr:hypothetical protein [Bosea sp. BK604]